MNDHTEGQNVDKVKVAAPIVCGTISAAEIKANSTCEVKLRPELV